MSFFTVGQKPGAAVSQWDPDSLKILIYQSELERILRWTSEYPDMETGGDLFGYFTHSGAPVACRAIGPGPGCRRRVTSFHQDADYLLDSGVAFYKSHGLQHIGEWHSHHRLGLPHPSSGDIATVTRSLVERGWNRFVLGIYCIDDISPRVTGRFYIVRPDGGYRALRLVALPGESPVGRPSVSPSRQACLPEGGRS